MLKKLLLLPLAVLAFAAVFAAPAMASEQFHFLHNGEPIGAGEAPMLTYTGPASFENEAGGIACEEATATVDFTTHEAHVTSFIVNECETTGLLPAFGCELTARNAPTAAELPWTLTPVSTTQAVTNSHVLIHNPMKPGCAFGEDITAETGGSAQVTINAEAGNLDAVELGGSLVTPIGEVEVHGELTADVEGTITLVST